MRYLIAGSAALAVVIAAALLVVPRLFDEEALALRLQKAVLEATGEVLVIEGGLDLSLLPRPLLSLHRLRVDDARSGVSLVADRLDLELAAGPLLTGELGASAALLVRPELRLMGDPVSAFGHVAALLRESGAGATMQRLDIADGSLWIAAGDDTASPVWRGIDATIERDAITGTRHFAASGNVPGVSATPRLVLDGELGSAAPDRPRPLRLDLALEGAAPAVLGYHGRIDPGDAEALLEGRLTLDLPDPAALQTWLAASAPALAAWPVPDAPVAAEADIRLAPPTAAIPARLEAREMALTIAGQRLDGALSLSGGTVPRVDLRLQAGRLVLPDDWPEAGDPRLLAAALPADLQGRLAFEADELGWRDRRFRQIALNLRLDGDGEVRIERAVAVLPGPGDLDFTGRLGSLGRSGGHWLSGRLRAALQAPGDLLSLFGEPPALLRQSSTLALDTDLDWSAQALTLRNIDLSLDATRATGGIAWRSAAADGRAQLALKLTLDRLAIDELIDVRNPEAAVQALEAALPATDYAVDLRIERASLGEQRLGALTLRLDSVRGEVEIERASLAGLAGSALMLEGHITPARRAFDLDLALDIASLTRLLRLAGHPAPPALALLGPVNLRAHLVGDADRTTVDATLEGDSFAASARGTLDDWTTPRRGGEMAFTLAASDAAALLRQLGGVPITAPVFTGPLDAGLKLTLAEGRPRAWSLESTLGGLGLDLASKPGTTGDPGRLDLRLGPLSPAAAAVLYELATPLLDLVPGPPARWLGRWPDQGLSFAWLEGEPRHIRIELVPEGNPAAPLLLDAELANRAFTVPSFAWTDGTTHLAGSFGLEQRQGGAAAALSLDLALADAPAAPLAELLDLPRGLEGELDLEASFASFGRSIRTLIGNASGKAAIALEDGKLGDVAIDRLEGDLVLERGVLRTAGDGLDFTGPEGEGSVAGAVDLPAWLADLEVDVRAASPGAPAQSRRLLRGLASPAPSD